MLSPHQIEPKVVLVVIRDATNVPNHTLIGMSDPIGPSFATSTSRPSACSSQFFCQTSHRATKMNCTNGNEITTLGLFESQLLPENRYCEKNVMATATTFRYTLDTNRVSSSYPQGGGVGNAPHTTTEEDLVAVDPRSDHLTYFGWHTSSDCVLIQY